MATPAAPTEDDHLEANGVAAVFGDDVHVRTAPAAKVLGVSPRTLEKWRLERRYGPPYRQHGRAVVYRLRDLLDWSDSQKVGR